jgi:hypothetical protein
MSEPLPPATIDELRQGSEALRLWMNSVVEMRDQWGARRGVEVDALDALQCVFRVSETVVCSLRHIADLLEQMTPTPGLASGDGISLSEVTSTEHFVDRAV